MKNGIDVSKHQGTIDWQKVKTSGKADFCIIWTRVKMSLLSFMHSALSQNSNS